MNRITHTIIMLFAITAFAHGASTNNVQDTIIIELNNKSKIIIYTQDREALESLQDYDLNKMIAELNHALESNQAQTLIIEDSDGHRYMKDTTIVLGSSGMKTKIKIGNMEILIDAEDWDKLEEEFEDKSVEVTKSEYEIKPKNRTNHYFNIDIGINNWMENGKFPDETGKDYAVKPWGSWYIGLNSVNRTWISGPLMLDWGGGISWYNWKMQDAGTIITKGTESVEFAEAPLEHDAIKSRLTVPYINLTLLPLLDFSEGRRLVKDREHGSIRIKTYKKKGIRVGAGGYIGYRLGGNTKYVYKLDGDKKKDKDSSNFYLTNLRYGLRFQVGYKGIDLFAMYDLNHAFAEGRSPLGSSGLNALSFGLTF